MNCNTNNFKERTTMSKIILFYKYVKIDNPQEIMHWQRALCSKNNLKGRILLGAEGINATIGGEDQEIENYIKEMNNHPLFGGIDFKESPGNADCFPKLVVKVKKEIVHLGLDPETITTEGNGKHLKPKEVHELLNNKPEDLVIFDARNKFEWEVGRFNDAILPDIDYFRQFPEYVDQNLEQFKDKQVLMYCTGGIRCERASTYLKLKGVAKEVYQIEGGIHRYIEQFPDGHFRGKNYVFDSRVTMRANDDILGKCYICAAPNDDFTNCINARCNEHYTCCQDCKDKFNNCCSQNCVDLVKEGKVNVRPMYARGENSKANQC